MASPFSRLLLLPHKLSKGENAIKCYSPVPRRRGQTRAPQRKMRYSQPTGNARVRHGSPGGAGQAYLIGFVPAVTVISVLAGRELPGDLQEDTGSPRLRLYNSDLNGTGTSAETDGRPRRSSAASAPGLTPTRCAGSSGNGCSGQSREDAGRDGRSIWAGG